MNYRVAVLGPGSWGTALAQVLAENGHDVRIWGHRASQVEEINTQHTNQRYLPDHYLPDSIQAFTNMEDAVKTQMRCYSSFQRKQYVLLQKN